MPFLFIVSLPCEFWMVVFRFVAEELKSWNLLTRTGQHFEFINWKLTFFWLLGCFVRQF
jgi:glycerol-3-phosphate O-acyltransferase 3/4